MTVQELKDKLEAAIAKGQGDYQVMVYQDDTVLGECIAEDLTKIEVSTNNKTITLK